MLGLRSDVGLDAELLDLVLDFVLAVESAAHSGDSLEALVAFDAHLHALRVHRLRALVRRRVDLAHLQHGSGCVT